MAASGHIVAQLGAADAIQELVDVGPLSDQTRWVAELLAVKTTAVGIKAKTPEGMGTDNAAIAHVALLLVERPGRRPLVDRSAEEVPQPEIDEVVEQVVKTVPAPAKIKSGAKSKSSR